MNVGSAIERICSDKIEILSHFTGIDEIYVFSEQCSRCISNIPEYISRIKPDLIFDEEGLHKYMHFDPIKFGEFPCCKVLMLQCPNTLDTSIYDFVICNFFTARNREFYLPLSPGNIFVNREDPRNKQFVALARLVDTRFSDELQNKIKNRFGIIDLFSCNKEDDKQHVCFNYCGCLTRSEISDVLNLYKYLIVSYDECLSIPLREALLCGCLPIICDRKSYYTYRKTYADDLLRFVGWFEDDDKILHEKWQFLQDKNTQKCLSNIVGAEYMILRFLEIMRSITGYDHKIRDSKCKITYLHNTQSDITLDSGFNWDKISL